MLLTGKPFVITLIFIFLSVLIQPVLAQDAPAPEINDPVPASAPAPVPPKELAPVVDKLIRDGFDKNRMNALFSRKDVGFTTKGVSIFFSYFESAPNYHQFLKKKSIAKAALYAEEYKDALNRAEETYGVDKTVITAILLVETRLGTYLGKHATINMLASIAALGDKTLQTRIWKAIPKKAKPNKDAFLDKVKKRIPWGYEELKAFLTYTAREDIPPQTVRGSFAGAIGICQFMPSNALKIARDGNKDGKVDLFTHEDAIFSIANYLKMHGWKTGLSRQQQYDVIYTYNHSNYYVDTIQKVSDKLKEK